MIYLKRLIILFLVLSLNERAFSQFIDDPFQFSSSLYQEIEIPAPLQDEVVKDTWPILDEFLSSVAELPGDPKPKIDFVSLLLELLSLQHLDNIPWYVSHGADHNIRTVAIAMRLMEIMPEIVESAMDIYGDDSRQHMETLILLAVILHDIGYPDLSNHPVLPKFLHAEAGARIINSIIYNDNIYPLFDFLGEHKEKYIHDLISAIRYHNADHPENLKEPRKVLLSVNTNYLHEGETVQRKYVPAAVENKPLLFTVRISDNLDAHYFRLSSAQRKEWFQYFHYSITSSDEFKENAKGLKRGSADLQKLLIDHYGIASLKYTDNEEVINFINSLDENDQNVEKQPQVNTALLNAKPGDFPHFYSNWVISEIDFSRPNENILINITFQESTFDVNPGVAIYQIVRAADAIYSCTMNNKPMTQSVLIQSNEPKYLRGHNQLSLELFASDKDTNGDPISPDPEFTEILIKQ